MCSPARLAVFLLLILAPVLVAAFLFKLVVSADPVRVNILVGLRVVLALAKLVADGAVDQGIVKGDDGGEGGGEGDAELVVGEVGTME